MGFVEMGKWNESISDLLSVWKVKLSSKTGFVDKKD